MAQFQCPADFVPLQQVTAANLNAHVNNATALPGLINDQTTLSGSVEGVDSVLIYDNSTTALRKTPVSSLIAGGLPISTNSITGVSGADLVITPAAGQVVDVDGTLETDDLVINSDLVVTGSSTLTGNVIADNGFTSNGVANFTGTLQVNGTVGYVLYEVFEETVFYSNATVPIGWNAMYTSPSLTKPSNEIWVIESDLRWRHTLALIWAVRLNLTTPNTMLNGTIDIEGGGSDYWHIESNIMRYVFNAGTTFTSTITIDVLPSSVAGYPFYCGETNYTTAGAALNSVTFSPSKFRIYKYKTA